MCSQYRFAILLGLVIGGIWIDASAAEPADALNVRDFGAKGDGNTDDAPAIDQALAAAARHGPGATLFLPKGTYSLGTRTLADASIKRVFFLGVDHANGLTIEGESGTVLLSRDLVQTTFHLEYCQNVTIRRLTFDADPLPYTQGTVVAADPVNRTIDLQVDKAYDDIDRPDLLNISEFRICDSPYSNGWKEDQYFPKLENRVRLGPGHWQLTMAWKDYRYDAGLIGKKWMLWAKGYKGWVVHIGHSDGCIVDDLHIYEAGSGAFDLYGNGSVTIRQVTIGPPPGSDRIFCGGGGAMSFFNRGTVIVEDCDFSHIDDDGFNLGTHFVRVVGTTAPDTCRTELWPGTFQAGDAIVAWDWQKKVERGEAKVLSASKEKDGHWLVKFDRPLEFVTAGEGKPGATLKEQENDGIDRIVDLDSCGSCILRRNKISSMRARCFLVKTGHSVIEDNLFYDTHMPGVLAGPEFFWGEGPELRGLIIRHNVFRNIDAPNIQVATFTSAAGISNRDVTIEDNTFENYGQLPVIYMRDSPRGAAIEARNTDGVTIRNNQMKPSASTPYGVNPIVVETCRNVQMTPAKD